MNIGKTLFAQLMDSGVILHRMWIDGTQFH